MSYYEGKPVLSVSECADLVCRITPLVDPAVVGADVANVLSEKTKTLPLNADGKSVADLLAENGFTNFTTQVATGSGSSSTLSNGDSVTKTNVTSNAGSCSNNSAGNNNSNTQDGVSSNATMIGNAGGSGVDFGTCDPTMSFEGGRNGRPGKKTALTADSR